MAIGMANKALRPCWPFQCGHMGGLTMLVETQVRSRPRDTFLFLPGYPDVLKQFVCYGDFGSTNFL